MNFPDIDEFTESYWKSLKKYYGIKSAGFFEAADKKNNIGPSLSAFHSSRKALTSKASKTELQVYLRATQRLDRGLSQLLSGNRNMTGDAHEIGELNKYLEGIRKDELAPILRNLPAILKNEQDLAATIQAMNKQNAKAKIAFWKSKGIF